MYYCFLNSLEALWFGNNFQLYFGVIEMGNLFDFSKKISCTSFWYREKKLEMSKIERKCSGFKVNIGVTANDSITKQICNKANEMCRV